MREHITKLIITKMKNRQPSCQFKIKLLHKGSKKKVTKVIELVSVIKRKIVLKNWLEKIQEN